MWICRFVALLEVNSPIHILEENSRIADFRWALIGFVSDLPMSGQEAASIIDV
jgi:hypothetical protein